MLQSELIKKKLQRTFITSVYYLPKVDSTNSFAKKIKTDSSLIIAEYQTHGRGQFGRKWESENAKNILLTIRKKNWIEPANLNYLNFFLTYITYLTLRSSLPAIKKKISE